MKKLKKDKSPQQENPEKMKVDDDTAIKIKPRWPDESNVLTGTDKHKIHEENMEKLRSMSEKEILEEKEKLLSTLDPAIVAFLKSRRKELKVADTEVPSISNLNQAGRDTTLEDIKASVHLLNQPESEKWLHFDVFETNKLAWMKDVAVSETTKKKEYEARCVSINN